MNVGQFTIRKFKNYEEFYYTAFKVGDLLGKSIPAIITLVDMKAKH